jgi:hypothetical protein
MELSKLVGDVYGTGQDKTALYFSSWQPFGNRGDVGKVPKAGGSASALATLELEPRDLAVDDTHVYYTTGIRLMKVAKNGGLATMPATQFSSQSIALDAANIYGVPGDYGPYDRVVRVSKSGGETTELANAKRPAMSHGANGYNGIAVDASGIYVADSGRNRVVSFPLEGGTPKVLAPAEKQPFDIAIDESNVFFSLAHERSLMSVAKTGGKTTKLLSGLAEKAHIALQGNAVFTLLAGDTEGAPLKLAKVIKEDGKLTTLTTLAPTESADVIGADAACVYWVQRQAGKSTIYAMSK